MSQYNGSDGRGDWEDKRTRRNDSRDFDREHKTVYPDSSYYEEKGNDLRDSSGEKLNLNVCFGENSRAVRKISCKASDYPTDILKRVLNMYIKLPDIEIKDLILYRNLRSLGYFNDDRRYDRDRPDRLEDDGLPHKTLRELGIKDNQRIWVICKNTKSDWIPLPVTGDEVWKYLTNNGEQNVDRNSYNRITRKLGIHDRCDVEKMWGFINTTSKGELSPRRIFHTLFPERDNFVDTFYQALLNTEIILSESYIRFFTEIERLVWQDFHIPPPEKERAIMCQVNMAIKDAVLKSGYFDSRVAGVILCFYGKSAIRLPYSVNSQERFFLRKEGIEKGQLQLEKLIATEVGERAKNDIYERLILASLAECKDNLVYNTEVSVKYVLHPDLVRDALSKHFFHQRAHAPDVSYKRKSRQSRSMIACDTVYKSLIDHFKGAGFKVEISSHRRQGSRYDCYPNRNERRRAALAVAGLSISWRSDEVSTSPDNSGRKRKSL